MANSIRLLICDDHPIVREGLIAVLSRLPDIEIVAGASNGKEAIELYRHHRPDMLILDFAMPEMSGLETLIAIRHEFPRARVVIFSIYDGDEDIYRTLQAGASGYLLKTASYTELIKAIYAVYNGQMHLSTEVAARLAARVSIRNLTDREQEVLELLVAGKSNLEIGNTLFIAVGTVKAHINSILAKMQVSDRTQAAVQALERGLVHLE